MFRKEEQATRRRIGGAERHRDAHCRRILLVKSTAILAQKYLSQDLTVAEFHRANRPVYNWSCNADRKAQTRKEFAFDIVAAS